MSAYKDAFAVESDASQQRLKLAAEVLASSSGVVLLEGSLALRPMAGELICEVLDPSPSTRRCANEYEVLIENARRKLDSSKLSALLPDLPRKWLVVDDYGTGTVELWHAP